MVTCCVDGCGNGSDDDVTLFKFPTSRVHRGRWLEAIRGAGRLEADRLVAGSVLCSRHFLPADYEDYRGRVRLKRKVIPSVFEGSIPTSKLKEQKPDSSPGDNITQPKEEGKELLENGASEESPEQDRVAGNKIISEHCTEENCIEVTPEIDTECPDPPTPEMDHRQDIEDILTNYHIRNTPGELPMHSPTPEPRYTPHYIEISVGKSPGVRSGRSSAQDDCLIVLENVQVDVDPGAIMLARENDHPYPKEEQISLLTSSDEDDVIIEEPHIDTVEVSDETDEDDMPLVKLVKTKRKEKLGSPNNSVKGNIAKVFWGLYEYYCMECQFTSTNRTEYKKHKETHEKIMQVCDLCGFTTASKPQFARHRRKHKEHKSFRCHLCEYKAKHKMSLVYHMKSHDVTKWSPCTNGYKCTKCSFKTKSKSEVVKHTKGCSVRYACDRCKYVTKRASDLKRHKSRIHCERNSEVDE